MDSVYFSLATTTMTVVLTLAVTYLANSISAAIKKQRLNIAMYYLLINMLLNESKTLRLFIKNTIDDEILIPASATLYSSSVFELLQMCEIDSHAHFCMIDTCERYNLIRHEQKIYTKDEALGMLKMLKTDFDRFNEELKKVRNRSWLYYWLIDFKNLIFIPNRSNEQ